MSKCKTVNDGLLTKSSLERTKLIATEFSEHHFETLIPGAVCCSVHQKTLKSKIDNVHETEQPLLVHFPSEISLKIFSYLGPKDLCRCAQVCQLWSQLAKDGVLWREMYPVRWIFDNDWRFGVVDQEGCSCNCDTDVQSILPGLSNRYKSPNRLYIKISKWHAS